MFQKLSVPTIRSSVHDLVKLTAEQMSSLVIARYNDLGTDTLASLRNEALEPRTDAYSYLSKELASHSALKSKIEAANLCVAVSLATLATLRLNVANESTGPHEVLKSDEESKQSGLRKKDASKSSVVQRGELVKII